jgi:site-specific DNA-methyltransferase (cytosine-N4-specific)
VLYPYGLRMENLLRNGYNAGPRPSEHHISHKWARRNRGAISPNILVCPNPVSSDPYLRRCRSFQLQAHPARFPAVLPRFFIRFLTEIGDVVLDPFAGSNVTGREAENNNRHWLAFERDQIYLEGSSLRFFDLPPRRPLAPAAMQTRSASTPPSVP